MVWTILGQDRISGKLEAFVLLKDGASPKRQAFNEASESVEVLAIIQGNHIGNVFHNDQEKCTKYGVDIADGSNRFVVAGNTIFGNVLGPIRMPTITGKPGPTMVVANNAVPPLD